MNLQFAVLDLLENFHNFKRALLYTLSDNFLFRSAETLWLRRAY